MNKLLIGQGNMQDFAADYEKTALVNKGRMWSLCYPTGKDSCHDRGEFTQHYEWQIGYEDYDKPQQPQQQIQEMVL